MNEREASWQWIRERLKRFASDAGVQINEPEILPLPKGGGEMLHVEGQRQHVRLPLSDATLDELHHEDAGQQQMELQLRDLIARIAKVGDRVIVERFNGLYDVERISEPGKVDNARSDLKSIDEAWQIARGHVETGGRVWLHRQNSFSVERMKR